MVIGVLAVQGDFAAHARALERVGARARLVRRAEELEGLDGLVLPGGESTAMLKLLRPGGFWERLRGFVERRPTLGTCAGAILLARRVTNPEQASLGALDATVVRNAYGRQAESSIRRAEVAPEHVAELGTAELEAVLIRAPQFTELGPGVEVIARAAGQPVLLRQGPVVAASFHPELSEATAVHRWFVGLVASCG
ncbi:MAG TPA: pyridoxal 5'-phosphate synthase glutaminase subunit PdxT [Terriglobales bacterium]|nr:pyridoxal 5'-phosphate synthase glutaminase subunit PdxT [Terriglobales bacterium]